MKHKDGDSNNQHLYDSIHWMDAYKHLTILIEGHRTAKRHTFTLVVSYLAPLVSGGLLLARLGNLGQFCTHITRRYVLITVVGLCLKEN
ncbi:hypothetical protein [Vibrio sp. A1-b2]|uniref:hypothetical protein n=1 Tax=Vibrio sp. A1-b2 TaxID=2912248 RepID=UPI000B07FEE7|nr:hypothetical protein [Vibrio sp. A1-b2]